MYCAATLVPADVNCGMMKYPSMSTGPSMPTDPAASSETIEINSVSVNAVMPPVSCSMNIGHEILKRLNRGARSVFSIARLYTAPHPPCPVGFLVLKD